MKENHKVPFSALGVTLAIGIVFGDIGTSPLYVMRAILNALPAGQLTRPDYILGAVSCVIWTLTIQTSSGFQHAFYSMVPGALYPTVKRPGCEINQSLPSMLAELLHLHALTCFQSMLKRSLALLLESWGEGGK